MPKRVLVIGSGREAADALREALPSQHFTVSAAGLERALEQASSAQPDLIVLDGLSAPDQAVKCARHLHHQAPGTRVVAVVPSVDPAHYGDGFTCLSKLPTEDELVAWLGEEGGSREAHLLRVGKVLLDLDTRQLNVDGEISVLTPKQFKLLRLFMSRPGQVLTRKQLMKDVWDTDYTGDTRTLDVHIHWVREKLGDVPGQPKYLQTVRRVGYRFVDPGGAAQP